VGLPSCFASAASKGGLASAARSNSVLAQCAALDTAITMPQQQFGRNVIYTFRTSVSDGV